MKILEEIFIESEPAKLLLEIGLGRKEKKEFEETVYWHKLISEKISDEENFYLFVFFKCWKRQKYQLLNYFAASNLKIKLNPILYPIVISNYVVQCVEDPGSYLERNFFGDINVNDYLNHYNYATPNLEEARVYNNPEDNFYFSDFHRSIKSYNFQYLQAIPIKSTIGY